MTELNKKHFIIILFLTVLAVESAGVPRMKHVINTELKTI